MAEQIAVKSKVSNDNVDNCNVNNDIMDICNTSNGNVNDGPKVANVNSNDLKVVYSKVMAQKWPVIVPKVTVK